MFYIASAEATSYVVICKCNLKQKGFQTDFSVAVYSNSPYNLSSFSMGLVSVKDCFYSTFLLNILSCTEKTDLLSLFLVHSYIRRIDDGAPMCPAVK